MFGCVNDQERNNSESTSYIYVQHFFLIYWWAEIKSHNIYPGNIILEHIAQSS